ncbi:MAG: ABC-type multidrug transport system, ATPase and permease component [Frankiales bacterium]|nr:ABC-type multidrug transport system, ATPase and permease component [Frankiales bacterium]
MTTRPEWQFFRSLWHADRPLATVWWSLMLLRGLLPIGLAVGTGRVVDAISSSRDLTAPLVVVGVLFVLLQVAAPLHAGVSANLGNREAAWLYDRLTDACVTPAGIGHLEDPELTDDLSIARDFDLGHTGPPMSFNVDFIQQSMVTMVAGIAAALTLGWYVWWGPFVVGGAWVSTHYLLRESGVWKDRLTPEVRSAQRDAEYAYRMAVDPPAAKELRLFGLAPWTIARFTDRRRRLFELQTDATRLRERSVLLALVIVGGANALFFWSLSRTDDGLGATVVAAQLAAQAGAIAFGGLNWTMDACAAAVSAVLKMDTAMAPRGALSPGTTDARDLPVALSLEGVRFGYPRSEGLVFDGLDLVVTAGSSLAIVGQNGAGKTTLAKLLCRLYDPTAGAIRVSGVDLRELDITSWRERVTAVFQDFIRFELSLRDNVDPGHRATDEQVLAALADAGAEGLAELDQPLSKQYRGGTDLSGGQWQRVALARALCAVRAGAGLVLLDEPTAQLDVRGEAEIFGRVLEATRGATTILVSHRFSTVRRADRICVLEHGRVIELGSHDELMALGGRYRTMFDLQASRFFEESEEEGVVDAL